MLFSFNRHYVRSMQAGWENYRSADGVCDPLPPSEALHSLTEGENKNSHVAVVNLPERARGSLTHHLELELTRPSNVRSSLVMKIMNIIRIAAALLTIAMLQTTAAAHDFSTSYSRVTVHGETVEVRLTLNQHY